MEPRFRGVAGDWRAVPLDALTAIYHHPSGITHLVAPPAPEILEVLDDQPATADMVLARLAATFDLADADRAAVAARLEELAAAGLAVRI